MRLTLQIKGFKSLLVLSVSYFAGHALIEYHEQPPNVVPVQLNLHHRERLLELLMGNPPLVCLVGDPEKGLRAEAFSFQLRDEFFESSAFRMLLRGCPPGVDSVSLCLSKAPDPVGR